MGEFPNNKIKVKVEKGWVSLEGEVQWYYQKQAARDAVKNPLGVVSVSNNITIKHETLDQIEKKDIESALKRNRSIYPKNIIVKASDHKVTLTGTVKSWYQKNEASQIAWKAPGVRMVDNELVVEYNY